MIEPLFSLNTAESKDGLDTLLVNQNGWTVAHIAAHASDLATMKYPFLEDPAGAQEGAPRPG